MRDPTARAEPIGDHSDLTVTKQAAAGAGTVARAPARRGSVQQRAVQRLQVVCLALFAIWLSMWLTINLVQHTFAAEFRSLGQWGPAVTGMVASLMLFAIARGKRLTPGTVIRAGLVYQVIVSFAIVTSGYIGAFEGTTPAEFTPDRIGISWVLPWTLFFTVLVQAQPRAVLLALVASNAAPSIVFAGEVAAGRAPVLPAGTFFLLFVFPYVIGVGLNYLAAHIVHQLGVEAERARELGSYRLEARLGQGGMGEVWRATHHTLARPAAIKVIRSGALGSQPEQARLAAARFEREAQVIASLQSRHTVALYDFGTTDDGTLFYVMELLDGVDLEELVHRHGPLPPERVVHILRQACASLGEAHRRGVVHRDIKPANIYLCREAFECDVVKILDFGLVKRLTPARGADVGLETRADQIAGTPAYIAPEVAMGHDPVDGRADLYGLGCVAYWLLTGRLLFEASSPIAVIAAHVGRQPEPPSRQAELPVSAALDRIVLDCLAKDPALRPASAEQLAARLAALPEAEHWTQQEAMRWWELHEPLKGS